MLVPQEPRKRVWQSWNPDLEEGIGLAGADAQELRLRPPYSWARISEEVAQGAGVCEGTS